jgi:hypothetical protein
MRAEILRLASDAWAIRFGGVNRAIFPTKMAAVNWLSGYRQAIIDMRAAVPDPDQIELKPGVSYAEMMQQSQREKEAVG